MPFRVLRFSESLPPFVESKTSVFFHSGFLISAASPHQSYVRAKTTQAAPRQCRHQCDIPYLLKFSSLIFKMVPANILTSSNGTSWLYQGIADQSPLPNMPYLPFRRFSNQLSGYHGLLVLSYLLYWSYPFSPDCSRVPENLSLFYTFCTFATVSLLFFSTRVP